MLRRARILRPLRFASSFFVLLELAPCLVLWSNTLEHRTERAIALGKQFIARKQNGCLNVATKLAIVTWL